MIEPTLLPHERRPGDAVIEKAGRYVKTGTPVWHEGVFYLGLAVLYADQWARHHEPGTASSARAFR